MKRLLQAFCLSGALVLALAPTARAEGFCYVQCSNGFVWTGETSTQSACCQRFGAYCEFSGVATWEGNYCPSW